MQKTSSLCFLAIATVLALSACDSGGDDPPAEQRCEDYDAINFNEPGECEYEPGTEPGDSTSMGNFATLKAAAETNGRIELIGAAVNAGVLQNNQQYADTLAAQFNAATPENAMKWQTIQPEQGVFNFEPADRIVAFAQENDMQVRGHTLVWHSQLAGWVENGDWSEEELLDIMKTHIDTVVTHYEENYPGVVVSWDVVNEAVDGARLRENGNENGEGSSIWMQTIGEEYIDSAFVWADRYASDDVELYYNDYSIAGGGSKEQRVYQLVSDLVSRDVPIDGVGFQSHLAIRYDAPRAADLQARLENYEELGLNTAITELDVGIDVGDGEATPEELQAQANYYARFLRACIDASNCSEFRLWGFTDSESWRADLDPLIYDDSYQRKPAFEALVRELSS